MKTNIKSNKLNKLTKFFTIITAIVLICLSVTMADLFSSLITVGGFTFTNNDITLNKYNIYAICTVSTETKAIADERSVSNKNQGGAGFIYMHNSKFYVIASIYENESDAIKVKDNLKESNQNVEILNIQIPSITLSSSLESEEKTTLENSLTIFKTTYKELYDISISLDTGVINEVNARLKVNELGSKINTISTNFTTLFNNQMSNNFLIIKLKLKELTQTIDSLINSSTSFPYTSKLKETYSKTIELYQTMANSLNKST